MSYVELLGLWRFAEAGSPYFTGEVGDHFSQVMKNKREEVGNDAHVAASKSIGW